MLLVLIPFFAFGVLSDTLGEGRLERMFLSIGRRKDGAEVGVDRGAQVSRASGAGTTCRGVGA
jgi:hypothetical protein